MTIHREGLHLGKLRTLYSISLLFAVATAFVAYTESSFLEMFVGKESVGVVFAASYCIALLVLVYLGKIIALLGKRNTVLALLLVSLLALLVLMRATSAFFVLPAFAVYIATLIAAWVGFDVLIETFSSDGLTGRIRGTQLTIMNVGWVITPVIAGFVLEIYGFAHIFTIALFVTIIVAIILALTFKNADGKGVVRTRGFFATLRTVMEHRSISHIFIIAFLLQFFYAWMVIYTPLYLLSIGIDWSDIGKIFSFMLLPFVLFEYPAGWIADRWLGEKEILITGLLIIAGATGTLFFIQTSTLWVWAVLLFATRIGASLIEVMRDTYFFKQVDKRDVYLIDFFRNTGPMGYMIAPLVATPILAVAPMKTLFIVLGVIMFCGVLLAARIPDTK